jgi:predicted nucleic acid-binding protein
VLVVDASTALAACGGPGGFELFGAEELVAPHLLWSESRSALHEARWRHEISREQALATLEALGQAPIGARNHPELGTAAWSVADEMGWAKTHDAEYVALARLLGCRLVTLDRRLRIASARLGFVISPSEL